MNYDKIRTFTTTKPKPKQHPVRKVVALALSVLLIGLVVHQVSALSYDISRTKSVEPVKVVKDTSHKKEAVKSTENASVASTPASVPAPAPLIDPNHCEPDRYWRADNYECIDKPAPDASVANATSVATSPSSSAPAPAAAPVAATNFGGPNCELARQLIAQYDWNQQSAYDVMVQESHCDPMAANTVDVHETCIGSFGLFQINCMHGQLFDPAANVAAAYAMWKVSGWAPWSFTTCKIVTCI